MRVEGGDFMNPLNCPCSSYDEYLDKVAHPGDDARICTLRGIVIFPVHECRHCFRGRLVYLIMRIGRGFDRCFCSLYCFVFDRVIAVLERMHKE